jgi:hypothetical protein
MAKGKNFIISVLKKAGIEKSEIDAIEGLDALDFEIPDNVAGVVDTNLFTEKDAKNNSALKDHYLNTYISSLDQNLEKQLKSKGFSKEEIDKVFENRNYTDRRNSAFDLLTSKTQSNDSEAVKRLTAEIEIERKKVSEIEELSTKQINELRKEYTQKEIDSFIESRVLSKNWSDSIDKEDRLTIFKAKLDKHLQQNEWEIVNENGNKVIKSKKNPELYAQRNNKNITFEDIEEDIYSNSKYLAVSTPQTATPTITTTGLPSNTGGNATHKNPITQKAFERALADQLANQK